MMKKIFITSLLILTFNLFSYENILGSTPETLIDTYGPPNNVYVERGKTESEDDVVLFYKSRLYVYFNHNRAWQVRLDREFKDKVLDISIGDDIESVITTLGAPKETLEDSIIYIRPDRGYSVFMRLYFNNEKLEDIYFYRGDY